MRKKSFRGGIDVPPCGDTPLLYSCTVLLLPHTSESDTVLPDIEILSLATACTTTVLFDKFESIDKPVLS